MMKNYVIPFGLILVLLALVFISGFNGLYGQDAHDYLHCLRSIKAFFFQGIPMPNYLHPIVFPFIGFLFSCLSLNDIFAIQLVSILSLAALFIYLRRLILLLHESDKWLDIYLLLFFVLSPYVFRFSILVMSDMLCTSLCIAAFYHAIIYSREQKLKDFVWTIIMACLAFQTRYASLIIILVPAYMLIRTTLINMKYQHLVLAIFLMVILLMPEYLLRNRFLIFDLKNIDAEKSYHVNTSAWSLMNIFRNHFTNVDGDSRYLLPNIIFNLMNLVYPSYLFIGVFLILGIKKIDVMKQELSLVVIMIVMYILFLSGLAYQISRYLLLTFPFILILLYPSFVRIIEKYLSNHVTRNFVYTMIVVLQCSFFIYSMRTIYRLNQTELAVANSLYKYNDKTIYTASIDVALETYLSNKLINLYYNDIDNPPANSLLLYNKKEFTDHWGSMHPNKTFERLLQNNSLTKIESLPRDWELYEIK